MDKNVIVGVTASIAAYKSALLVREFVKQGANVKVIQTPESQKFITPLTLSTLSKNPVLSGLVKEKDNWVKVKLDTELIENHSRLLLDHFSNSGPVSGTSLVALNLNNEDKAIVYEDENDGETKIKVMISFPRAWAAVERSLKIAGLDLVDKNRDEGKFYLSWKGSPSFFNRSENNRVIQVRIEKIEEDISIISIFMENKDLEVSKEIISQINQALT